MMSQPITPETKKEFIAAFDSIKGVGASDALFESARIEFLSKEEKNPTPGSDARIRLLKSGRFSFKPIEAVGLLSKAIVSAGGKLPTAPAAPAVIPPTRAELAAKALKSLLKLPSPSAEYGPERHELILLHELRQMGMRGGSAITSSRPQIPLPK